MKTFETPVIDVVNFAVADVITESDVDLSLIPPCLN